MKVTYEDIAPCPHFSKRLNHTEFFFFFFFFGGGGASRNAQSPVTAKFRCRVGIVRQ